MKLRRYTDLDGGKHLGSLPAMGGDQVQQDFDIDRAELRRELRTWLNRWGREGKTLRLLDEELRLARRLMAAFDRKPE